VNSRVVAASSEDDMVGAFEWVASRDAEELATASIKSRELAAAYSIEGWGNGFRAICDRLVSEPTAS
jgi:hypothetical protein